MGTRVGKLTNQGDLLIAGEVNERLPSILNGLITHYAFDGSLNHYRSLIGLSILECHGTNATHPWTDWFASKGATITNVADISTTTVATAQQYDLVLADYFVWAIPNATMTQMKAYVDAGVPCISVGNDTRTNIFVATYNASGTQQTHDISFNQLAPIVGGMAVDAGAGSNDVIGGIQTLQGGAQPLYYRTDLNLITGYYYKSATSGAMLYFDQEGIGGPPLFVQNIMAYILQSGTNMIVSQNVVLSNEGLGLSRGTTNLIDATTTPGIYNNNKVPATLTKLTETYMGMPIFRLVVTPNTTASLNSFQTTHGNQGIYLGGLTYAANTQYTSSIYWRQCNKGDITVSGTPSNMGGWVDLGTYKIDDQWNRTVTKQTVGANAKTDNFFWGIQSSSAVLNETIYIDFACPQIESGVLFATDFVNGTRADSKFSFRATAGLGSATAWTVRIDYLHQDLSSFPNNMVFASSYGMIGAGNSTWFGLNANTNTVNNYGINFNSTPNVVHTAVFAYNGTATVVYIDGVNRGTYTAGQMFFNGSDGISFSSMTGWNANTFLPSFKIKCVSIYNRTLSATEAAILSGKKFSITKAGAIYTTIKERPNGIPSDAYYYPLMFNSKDQFRNMGPYSELNTVYDANGVWVGSSTINLVSYAAYSEYKVGTGTGTITKQSILNEIDINAMIPVSTDRYGIRQDISSGIPTGATNYTEQYQLMVLSASPGALLYGGYNDCTYSTGKDYGQGPVNINLSNKPLNIWLTFNASWTPSGDYTTITNLFWITGANANIKIRKIQLEQKPFASPFVLSSRPASLLTYNFNSSIGLDWSQNWSIVYWKKPVGTSDNTLNAYNIESLGCYSNSVGTGYMYFGKLTGSNVYGIGTANIGGSWTTTNNSLTPSTYFNNWQMISIVKNGATITAQCRRFSDHGIITSSTNTATAITAANFFVNQYGYDFELNGYSNSSPCSTYLRDLIVAKRAFSDTELTTIANTFMKSRPMKLQVQGGLSENNIL